MHTATMSDNIVNYVEVWKCDKLPVMSLVSVCKKSMLGHRITVS